MSDWIHITATDGYPIPVLWRPGSKTPGASFLVAPALGARAEFYESFAAVLAEKGYQVAVVEWRGSGRSTLRPSRRVDWGYGTLMSDLADVVRWLRDQAPGVPVVPVGHSLGGQVAVAAAALDPALFSTMVLMASTCPHYDHYSGSKYWQLYLGAKIVPLLFLFYGYFPGHRLGLGGREARGVIRDWLQLVIFNRFRIAGVDQDVEAAISGFRGRVLSIRFEDDELAPRRAVDALNEKLVCADLSTVTLTASEMGGRAGHFDLGRRPAAVCEAIDRWWRR